MKLLAMALALWASASSAEPFVIYYDPGGSLIDREFILAEQWNDSIEIHGVCASACTLYLGLPDVCAYPSSIFVFHGPMYLGSKMPQYDFDYWSLFMAAYYPSVVAEWFMTEGRFTETWITGQHLIDISAVRPC